MFDVWINSLDYAAPVFILLELGSNRSLHGSLLIGRARHQLFEGLSLTLTKVQTKTTFLSIPVFQSELLWCWSILKLCLVNIYKYSYMRSICHTRGIDICKMVMKHKFELVTKKTSQVKTCQRLASKLRLRRDFPISCCCHAWYTQVNIYNFHFPYFQAQSSFLVDLYKVVPVIISTCLTLTLAYIRLDNHFL